MKNIKARHGKNATRTLAWSRGTFHLCICWPSSISSFILLLHPYTSGSILNARALALLAASRFSAPLPSLAPPPPPLACRSQKGRGKLFAMTEGEHPSSTSKTSLRLSDTDVVRSHGILPTRKIRMTSQADGAAERGRNIRSEKLPRRVEVAQRNKGFNADAAAVQPSWPRIGAHARLLTKSSREASSKKQSSGGAKSQSKLRKLARGDFRTELPRGARVK